MCYKIIKNYKNSFKLLNMGYLSKYRLGIQFQLFLEKCYSHCQVKLKSSTTFHLLTHHKCAVDQLDSKTIANELIVIFESRKLHFKL